MSVGIWYCKNCSSKFTGKAYTIAKAISFEEAPVEVEEKESLEKAKEPERLPKANLEESSSAKRKTDLEEMRGNEHFDKRQKPFDKVNEEVT